jgi:hypothetical protein
MTKTSVLVIAVLVTLALPSPSQAHPDHSKKVLGVVTMADATHVMVKTADGKEQTIALNAQTKLRQGKKIMKPDALKVGTRVVIALTAKEPPTAADIQIGAAVAAPKK